MSALRMIAWGMVEEPSAELRRAARDEMEPFNLWVTGVSVEDRREGNGHRLTKIKGGRRRSAYCVGSFADCCRRALEIIEPHNYPTR